MMKSYLLCNKRSLRTSAHSYATAAIYLRLLRFLFISRETVLIDTETCGSFAISVNENPFASKAEMTYLCSRVKCLYIDDAMLNDLQYIAEHSQIPFDWKALRKTINEYKDQDMSIHLI